MSKLILENKGALASGTAKHPRAAKKRWAATAGVAAMADATGSAAPQQPLQADYRQIIPPTSKQPQIKYTGVCVPLSRKTLSLVVETFCSDEFWCYK